MSSEDASDLLATLTPREHEVLDLLRTGLTNGEIGGRLGISADGAKYHVSQIIRKLGVQNRYEAARWPERSRWWAGVLAPLGVLWRWAQAKAGGAALAASGALVVAAVLGLGLVAFLLFRDDGGEASDASSPGVSWEESSQAAVAPVFLTEPARISGDGWSFESRVANLGDLELVGLADELPTGVSLVDVKSGEVVASGTFGRNMDVRVLDDPATLLVADVKDNAGDNLLVFDLSGYRPDLAAQIDLPERPGWQGNFAQVMRIANDGKTLLIPQRHWIDDPYNCSDGGDGKICTRWSIGIVDIAARRFIESVDVPERCYVVWFRDTNAEEPVISCDEAWFSFDRLRDFRPIGSQEDAAFVDVNGTSAYFVLENGSVVDEYGTQRSRLALPGSDVGPSRINHGWPIMADQVLLGLNPYPPSETIFTSFVIASLKEPAVIASLRAPDGIGDLVVLDARRAVGLVKDPQGYRLDLLDLEEAEWVGSVPIAEPIEGYVFLVR